MFKLNCCGYEVVVSEGNYNHAPGDLHYIIRIQQK